MTSSKSPADASANHPSVPGGRTTKVKGKIAHIAPGNAMLLDVQAVAELLGCSTRHVYRLSDAGKMPAPVRLGCLVRWSAAAIQQWIDEGCPSVRRAGR
jgi:excisionase family DNA binding protein